MMGRRQISGPRVMIVVGVTWVVLAAGVGAWNTLVGQTTAAVGGQLVGGALVILFGLFLEKIRRSLH